ncbi:hypothetical protein [Lysinibacillus xylanilyticus]|uniref:hypothetical protein n=1 Tax=Lysinibacillus xylanilyticus TaxID=582475 RepID=UPI00382AE688
MKLHHWSVVDLQGKIGVMETISDIKQKRDFELLKSNIRRIKLRKVMEQRIENEYFKTYVDENSKIDFDIVDGDLCLYIGDFMLVVVGFGNRYIYNLELTLSIGFETKQNIMKKNSKIKVEVIVLDGIKKRSNRIVG